MAEAINSRDINNEDSSFGDLRSATSALGKLTDSLNSIAKEFKTIATELKKSTGSFREDFDDALEEEERSRRQGTVDFGKMTEGHIKEEHKYRQAAIKSLRSVLSYAFDKFTKGFNSVVDNYLRNFTEVVSKNYTSNSDYTQAMYRFTDWISEKGLKVQFSQNDLNDQMVEALSVGIRGPLAETMAEQNVVTKRLMGYINVNTKAYTRLSKDLGQSFSDAVISMGKYSEQLYGAMGLEENGLEDVLDTIYREVLVAASEQGWTKEQASAKLMEVADIRNKVAGTMGDAAAEEFLNTFKDVMTGNTSNVIAMTLSKTGYADPTALLSKSTEAFLEDWMDLMMDLSKNSQMMEIMGNEAGLGGYNTKAAQDIYLYKRGFTRSIIDEATARNAEYLTADQLREKLSGGYAQSLTAQQEKWNENVSADLATLAASSIPDVQGTLHLISGIVSNFFNAWRTKAVGDVIRGGGGGTGGAPAPGAGAGDPGSGVGSGGILSKLTGVEGGVGKQLLMGKLGHGVGSTIGSSSITALQGVIGSASLAGGLFLAGRDAYMAGSKAAEDGNSVAAASLKGFFTGRSIMSNEEEASARKGALSGQRREFDWGSAFSNAGKMALIGGGAATLGGPLGTAAGAVIGGVAGFLENAVTQWVENIKYNDLADAVNASTEAFNKLDSATGKYLKAVKDSKEFTEISNKLQETHNMSQREQDALLTELKKKYGQYIPNVQSLKDITDDQIKQIQKQLDIEKELAAIESAKSFKESMDSFDEVYEGLEGLYKGTSYNTDINPLIKDLYKLAGTIDEEKAQELVRTEGLTIEQARNKTKGQANLRGSKRADALIEKYAQSNGLSVSDVQKQLQTLGFGSGTTSEGGFYFQGEFAEKISDFVKNYDTGTGIKKGEEDKYLELASKLSDMYSQIIKAETNLSAILVGDDIALIKTEADSLKDAVEKYNKYSQEKGIGTPIDLKKQYGDYSKVHEKYPGFKSGLSTVPYDEFPAILHEGETVLPKSAAEDLRELSGSSISNMKNFLSALVQVKAVATPAEDNRSYASLIVTAINDQTERLSELLDSILASVQSISSRSSGSVYSPYLMSYGEE